MEVAEIFESINGEGVRAGELAVFVRFKGCNLRCSYCDTMWANEESCQYEERSPKEIYEYILSTGIRNVTLTGGEPLLQKDMGRLLELLGENDFLRVEIETNGAVDLAPFCRDKRPVFCMDYKLPSSGSEESMLSGNLRLLDKYDTVKFVSGSLKDLERAKEIIDEYRLLDRCHVYFSPVFGKIEPSEIVDFMKAHKMNEARLQIQIHKFIWDPDRKGV
ncbi:MAG: putative 7-carboxy-7-deazaguanine synthase QueE [Lachnospiraceae bacterium]|nr:putative 7-carboxy-7-deazaguanine synthase QueE [Lachnospiraceae bacterium]